MTALAKIMNRGQRINTARQSRIRRLIPFCKAFQCFIRVPHLFTAVDQIFGNPGGIFHHPAPVQVKGGDIGSIGPFIRSDIGSSGKQVSITYQLLSLIRKKEVHESFGIVRILAGFQYHGRAGVDYGAAGRIIDGKRFALVHGGIGVVVHTGYEDSFFTRGYGFQSSLVGSGIGQAVRHPAVDYGLGFFTESIAVAGEKVLAGAGFYRIRNGNEILIGRVAAQFRPVGIQLVNLRGVVNDANGRCAVAINFFCPHLSSRDSFYPHWRVHS